VEGWHALSVDNLLHVAGLSPFGVAVLYMAFAVMLLVSLLFLLWGARADSSRRFFFWNTLFVTSISCMCYLAMATGNGILVLRCADPAKEPGGSQPERTAAQETIQPREAARETIQPREAVGFVAQVLRASASCVTWERLGRRLDWAAADREASD
jgi:hypothetical protein